MLERVGSEGRPPYPAVVGSKQPVTNAWKQWWVVHGQLRTQWHGSDGIYAISDHLAHVLVGSGVADAQQHVLLSRGPKLGIQRQRPHLHVVRPFVFIL